MKLSNSKKIFLFIKNVLQCLKMAIELGVIGKTRFHTIETRTKSIA